MSHPARGAWIEIGLLRRTRRNEHCRTPQGVRGLKFVPIWLNLDKTWCRTPQGVRGLKSPAFCTHRNRPGRTPQGVRGLKYAGGHLLISLSRRTPQGVRGLKCCTGEQAQKARGSRTPQGVRGLKSIVREHAAALGASRTPQGVRGLKYRGAAAGCHRDASHPARGAWIEIPWRCCRLPPWRSHPARGAWIEILISSGVL